MRFHSASIKFLVCLIGITMAGITHAEENVEIMSAEGNVMTADSAGKASKPVQTKSTVPSGNVVTTGPNSRAVIRVGSDGFIVVGKNSQVEINKTKDHPGFFKHIAGAVYYAMNTIKGDQRPIEVKTVTAVIGIRGTRFLVTDMPERNEIAMRKGLVNVASPEGEFELHKKAVQDEFEAFKHEGEVAIAKEKRAFDEYKAKNQKEFIEYKREFGLAANRMATFDGKRVEDRPLSDETKKDLDSFEAYAEEWLKQVND